MNTNHNRIKVSDLETNNPDKTLKTNSNGDRNNSDPSTINRPTLSIIPSSSEVYLECEF